MPQIPPSRPNAYFATFSGSFVAGGCPTLVVAISTLHRLPIESSRNSGNSDSEPSFLWPYLETGLRVKPIRVRVIGSCNLPTEGLVLLLLLSVGRNPPYLS